MNHNNLKMESMENKWRHHAATLDTRHTGKPQQQKAAPTNKGHPTLATNQTTTPATNTMDTTHLDNERGKQHQHQHQQRTQQNWTTQKEKSPQATTITNTWRNQQTSKKDTPKDSNRSIQWQPQERLKIQWTRQHLDSYLALAEVRCEWNVEPG